MLRLSKLTDYAMVILAHMGQNPGEIVQASEIAKITTIAKPTVAKLLKELVKGQILVSQRGATGGYKLAKDPSETSIASIIIALEGPLAITECNLGEDHCVIASKCPITSPWIQINKVIYNALDSYKLSNLVSPKDKISFHLEQ